MERELRLKIRERVESIVIYKIDKLNRKYIYNEYEERRYECN